MSFDDQETIALFLEESFDGLTRVETLLLEIENGELPEERLNALFRDLHTIKGTSSFLDFHKVEAVAHAAEDLLGRLRAGELSFTGEQVTVFLAAADLLRSMLTHIRQSGAEGNDDVTEVVTRLRSFLELAKESPVSGTQSRRTRTQVLIAHELDDTRRQLADGLTALGFIVQLCAEGGDALGKLRGQRPGDPPPTAEVALLSSDLPVIDGLDLARRYFDSESPTPKAPLVLLVKSKDDGETAVAQLPNPLFSYALSSHSTEQLADHLDAAVKGARASRPEDARAPTEESTIRVGVNLLDQLMNLVGELVLARNQILQVASSEKEGGRANAMATAQRLNIVTSELQQQVMRTRMQPIARLFEQIPRVVRNTARATQKDVVCHVDGNSTELDRTFIELVRDPLMHILRNAIDHGIEPSEKRRAIGKPAAGSLRVRAFHEGGSVNIEVEDDGAGLDPKRLRDKAVEKGLMTPVEAARKSDREITEVIFMPGFSTAATVTETSGRGVGMDVVRTQVERSGGQVELSSVPGQGTTVRLKIPLTLAIVPALLVSDGGQRFALPQINVVELVHLQQASTRIEHVCGAEIYRLRGTVLPLVRLSRVLQTENTENDLDEVNIVVLAAGDRRFGLLVSSVQDTVEIVVKPLHRQLKRLTSYSGATVLGDGAIALILDVLGIAAMCDMKVTAGRSLGNVGPKARTTTQSQTVLVFTAGDSLCTVPLSMVSRIELVPTTKIERVASREVLQYRNTIMPLLRPEAALGLGPTTALEEQPIIVFDFGRPVGFAINSIADIVEVDDSALRTRDVSPGILGSLVVLGKTSLILDVFWLVKQVAPELAQEKQHTESAKRVLVVEDSLMMRAVVWDYLRAAGYEPSTAANAEGALEMLAAATEERRPFSAVISDVEMPGMDGFSLVRHIRANNSFRNLAVVVMSRQQETVCRERALASGADAYLVKLDRTELEKTLASLVSPTGKRAA